MVLIFLVYAATGVIFFKQNDPYHFGNIGMAMWSYFEITTLDVSTHFVSILKHLLSFMLNFQNWSEVLNINYYGCDRFDAGYYVPGTEIQTVQTGYGKFYLPVCSGPIQQPLKASALFTFFILMCGFVMVSLTVAFVTTGINNKLRTLKEEEDELELLVEQGRAPSNKSNCCLDGELKRRRPSLLQSLLVNGKKGIVRSINRGIGSSNQSGSAEGSSFADGLSKTFGSRDEEDTATDGELKRSNSNGSLDSSDSGLPTMMSRGFFSSSERPKRKKEPSSLVSKNVISDPDLLRALLTQVWKTEDGETGILKDDSLSSVNLKRRKGIYGDTRKVGNFNGQSFKRTMKDIKSKKVQRSDFQKWLMNVGVHMRVVVGNKYYAYFMSIAIVIAAVAELLTVESTLKRSTADSIGIICQVIFTFDLAFKFMSYAPKYSLFFDNSWNAFDTILVILLWIPILAVGAPNIVYFGNYTFAFCIIVCYSNTSYHHRTVENNAYYACLEDLLVDY